MCATFEFNGVKYKPKQKIPLISKQTPLDAKWIGFSREEIQTYWKRKGELCIIPVDKYAERNHQTHHLTWMDASDGEWIQGVLFRDIKEVRLFTRAATKQECEQIGHDRMPLIVKGDALLKKNFPKKEDPQRLFDL